MVWNAEILATEDSNCANIAAKICIGPASYRQSTRKLLEPLGWMGFSQLGEFTSLQLLHRIINTQTPSLLHSKLDNPLPGNTRAASSGNLKLPPYNKMESKRSFSYKAVQLYNNLPVKLKIIKKQAEI